MTAPEREALVERLRDAAMSWRLPDALDSRTPEMEAALYDAAADMIEATDCQQCNPPRDDNPACRQCGILFKDGTCLCSTPAVTVTEERETRNARVQERWDELRREGKHGYYETLFQVVREEVEASALSLRKREREWLPIESAPKDGTDFLAYYNFEPLTSDVLSGIDLVAWDDGKFWASSPGAGYKCARAQRGYTHWMPLPASPADMGGGK